MSEYTPGPWKADIYKYRDMSTDKFTRIVPVVCGKKMRICAMDSDEGHEIPSPFTYTLAEAKANAKLIAAAPDLLEALIGLVDCAGLGRVPGYESEIDAAVAQARAVIAKSV